MLTTLSFGAGISLFFFYDNLLLKSSSDLEFLKYLTLNTLIDVQEVVGKGNFFLPFLVMFMIGTLLYIVGIAIFEKRDLPI